MIEGLQFSAGCDWTTPRVHHWQRWLGHLVGTPCVGLEVGVYEGRSSAWFLENICTHPTSHLFAVDPWAAKSEANRGAIERSEHGRRYGFFALEAERLFATWLSHRTARFDFVYLDGAKEAAKELEHTVMIWPLLKPGGILIWDDYHWQWTASCKSPRPHLPPGPGIDAFLAAYAPEIEVIARGWQVAVRKIDTAATT
jgi:predicted O-methyltransferase YrrM